MSTSPFNKYVVTVNGAPGQLNEYTDTPAGGILLIATPGTLFPSRVAAKKAIERTLLFSAELFLGWLGSEYEIHRVQEYHLVKNKRTYRK